MRMSEKERMAHPQLQLIPSKYWFDQTLFASKVPFWLIGLMKNDADVALELQKITINFLPKQQKKCTWLALVFSHPDLNNDEIWQLADQFYISNELRFKVAVSCGRVGLLNRAVTGYLQSGILLNFWEQDDSAAKLQDVLLEGNFSVFYEAASHGYLDIMIKLSELAATHHINVKSLLEYSFYSILQVAVRNGHAAVVHFLAKRNKIDGARDEIDVKDMLETIDTYGAYRCAQERKHHDVVALLDGLAVLHGVHIKNNDSGYRPTNSCGFFSSHLRLTTAGVHTVPAMLIN